MNERKQYKAPALDRFGTIADLSAGGSGAVAEATGNMMMMMAAVVRQRP